VRAKVKNLALGAAKMAVKAIKTRRTRRINSGKKVAGQRVRNRLLQAGVDLPISAPQAIANATVRSADNTVKGFSKTEIAQDLITSSSWVAQLGGGALIIPVSAGNEEWFPSLASEATQFQFFKFKRIMVSYAPSVSTSQSGEIAFCVVATPETAESISQMSDIIGQASVKSSVYDGTNSKMVITARDMNQTYLKQGYRVVSEQEWIMDDQTMNQAYIVVGVQNCGADGTPMGTLQVSYDVDLLKPRVMIGAVTAAAQAYKASNFASSSGAFNANTNLTHPVLQMKNLTADTALLTWSCRAPFVFSLVSTSAAVDHTWTLAATTPATSSVTVMHANHTASLSAYSWVCRPVRNECTFTLTCSAGATVASLHSMYHRVRVSDYNAILLP